MKKLNLSILILFVAICFNNISAQTIGKLYTKDEANRLYGAVYEKVKMTKSNMESILRSTSTYVMFRIKKGELIILGDNRKLLTSSKAVVLESDPYYMFTKDKIIALMKLGKSSSLVVEQRAEKLTITSGSATLQEAFLCPPFCD